MSLNFSLVILTVFIVTGLLYSFFALYHYDLKDLKTLVIKSSGVALITVGLFCAIGSAFEVYRSLLL